MRKPRSLIAVVVTLAVVVHTAGPAYALGDRRPRWAFYEKSAPGSLGWVKANTEEQALIAKYVHWLDTDKSESCWSFDDITRIWLILNHYEKAGREEPSGFFLITIKVEYDSEATRPLNLRLHRNRGWNTPGARSMEVFSWPKGDDGKSREHSASFLSLHRPSASTEERQANYDRLLQHFGNWHAVTSGGTKTWDYSNLVINHWESGHTPGRFVQVEHRLMHFKVTNSKDSEQPLLFLVDRSKFENASQVDVVISSPTFDVELRRYRLVFGKNCLEEPSTTDWPWPFRWSGQEILTTPPTIVQEAFPQSVVQPVRAITASPPPKSAPSIGLPAQPPGGGVGGAFIGGIVGGAISPGGVRHNRTPAIRTHRPKLHPHPIK